MPGPIDEIVKRRVIQQWLAGEAREKITADNDIGAGTVSIIVDDYKAGFDLNLILSFFVAVLSLYSQYLYQLNQRSLLYQENLVQNRLLLLL